MQHHMKHHMKHRMKQAIATAVIAIAIVAGAVWAQPGTSPGISRVAHDSSMTGSGTSSNKLAVDTSVIQARLGTCPAGYAIQSASGSGFPTCIAAGGGAGGGISGLTPGMVPTAASATTLHDSSISDTGTAASTSGPLTVGTELTTGGGGVSSVFSNGNSINFGYGANSSVTAVINAYGYNSGTTQYRSLRIDNGNGASIARFNGPGLLTELFGGLTVYGETKAATTAWWKWSGSNSTANFNGSSACGGVTNLSIHGGNSGQKFHTGNGTVSGCRVTMDAAPAGYEYACTVTAEDGSNASTISYTTTTTSIDFSALPSNAGFHSSCTLVPQ